MYMYSLKHLVSQVESSTFTVQSLSDKQIVMNSYLSLPSSIHRDNKVILIINY